MLRPLLATIANTAGEHVAAHGAEAVEQGGVLAYILHSNIINMIFVAYFLIWVCKKANLIGILKGRQDQVRQIIAKAEEDKAKAEELLNKAKEETKDLENQVKKIVTDAENSAVSIHEKIQGDTTQKVEEIEKNLNKMIAVEEKAAAKEVLNDISKEAYELASGKIKEALTDELHHKYINNFIDSLDEAKVK